LSGVSIFLVSFAVAIPPKEMFADAVIGNGL